MIEVTPEQYLNTLSDKLVSVGVPSNVIDVNPVQTMNAEAPIDVTESGIVIDVNKLQP